MRKPAILAAVLLLVGTVQALGFDYARYEATDLDTLMAQRRPKAGVDLHPALPMKLKVALVAYAEGCESGLLKRTMLMADIPKDQVDALAITRCIKIRSAKGKALRIFIQDEVANFLPKEVPLGSVVTLYVVHLFTDPSGPGLLVNEFSTDSGDGPAGAGKQAQQSASPCGCGTPDFHPGTDMTNDAEGARVQSVDDGVVVKIEQDERAVVDVPNIGRCGRYVVIKHDYPDGRVVFTRYAQLGRIVGSDGQPLTPGTRVTGMDKIGEVGSSKIMQFEIRPVDAATMETSADWTARYGADPSMEWSRYPSVDPKTFDLSVFGVTGKSGK
jgi:hypothetical protein